MKSKPIRPDLESYLKRRGLSTKFKKQLHFFYQNPRYPSLNTEQLEPKTLKIYSFRIDQKYRVIFLFTAPDEIEIIDINDHYQ